MGHQQTLPFKDLKGFETYTNTTSELPQYFDIWYYLNWLKVDHPIQILSSINDWLKKNKIDLAKGKFQIEKIQKKLGLQNIIFGRYVSFSARIIYSLLSFYILKQIENITQIKPVGLNLLSLGFGAKGKPNTYGHYSPFFFFININRHYKLEEGEEIEKFNQSGLISIIHEYGHFIDNIIGRFVEKYDYIDVDEYNSKFASLGGITSKKKYFVGKEKEFPIRSILEEVILYYRDILFIVNKKFNLKLKNYYFQRTELWARIFELYIFEKIKGDDIIKDLRIPDKFIYERGYIKDFFEDKELIAKLDKIFTLLKKQQKWMKKIKKELKRT